MSRPLPEVTPENEHFWRGGRDGELRLLRCDDCRRWVHPPLPACPACAGTLRPTAAAGRATVHAVTVNHQRWQPDDADEPFAVAVVRLDEQDDLLLVAEVPIGTAVGDRVGVRFEQHDDVWLPSFLPGADAPAPTVPTGVHQPDRRVRSPHARRATHVAITGIGQSAIGRRLHRDPLSLTVDACRAAIADAGLAPADIDGISTWPGRSSPTPGFSGVGVDEVQEALRLDLDWFAGGPEAPGPLGAVVNAYAAVRSGLANHVLCFRTVWEGTAQARSGKRGTVGTDGGRVPPGPFHWLAPFGAVSPAIWAALLASRHAHLYGTTKAQLGAIAVTARAHAGLNPAAVYREPLDLDDYLAARLVAEPLGLYDCDVPCDGSTAVIVSASASGIRIESVGAARHRPARWFGPDDRMPMAASDAAAMLWTRTDLRPADVDVAQLYDGFSILALLWLEALGFCEPGDGGAFVEGGKRIGLNGDLPLNTGGGQLSGGRLHGFGLLHEAVVQLRGVGGDRQVAGAEVAIVGAGGGPLGGCVLLTGPR
jgi:acetyl-CoA acetyltransferase/uncharacterized OB-fold protein